MIPPTYRETDKFLQTDKYLTKQSGFTENRLQFDGKGWTPMKVCDT